jgi:DNA-binding NtrC family response regulator
VESGRLLKGARLQLGEATLLLKEAATEGLAFDPRLGEVAISGTVDVKVLSSQDGLVGAGRRLPFLSMVSIMERALEVGVPGMPYQALCEVFTEALGCRAAKCYEIVGQGLAVQAVIGDFPEDRLPSPLAQAAALLRRPTSFEVLEGGPESLKALSVPVEEGGRRLAFVGVLRPDVDPLRQGIETFLMIPAVLKFLLRWVDSVQMQRKKVETLVEEVRKLRIGLPDGSGIEPILGRSPVILQALELADEVAPTDMSVLLLGPTGSGKELFARRIHWLSKRSAGPIIPINCSSIPEMLLESELFGAERGAYTGSEHYRGGFFQEASGGTLFLDEIGDMPLALQPKLLRVLEESKVYPLGSTKGRAVDVRVIAASNQDLRAMMDTGRFRRDLYFRLAQMVVELPPLGARREDIPLLAVAFLERANREFGKSVQGFEESALSLLTAHVWPGNVRELLHGVKRLVVMATGTTIGSELVQRALGLCNRSENAEAEPDGLRSAKETFEREYLAQRLKEKSGSMSDLARDLGISRPALYVKLKKFGLLMDSRR